MIRTPREQWARLLLALSMLVVAASPVSAQSPPSIRSTLKVGMWTLWHDKAVRLTPVRQTQLCAGQHDHCRLLTKTLVIHAEGADHVTLAGDPSVHSLRVTGSFTLAAHGESETLQNPVTIKAGGGMLRIAVTLPVESYVERVVASESGPADTTESLKALAIVVRSYALHEAHGHAEYDVCDSTHCQLLHWHGVSQRKTAAHNATLETAGETLWFHTQPALAYFNKDCGGQSAAVGEVWPKAGVLPYLVAHQDPWCGGAGQQWATELTRAELSAALSSHGLAAPRWQHFFVGQRAASGRVITVRLDGTVVRAEDFRIAIGETLGWNKIPSTWFEASQSGDRIAFHGRGWGHGVGLCQRGAAAMGSKGRSATEILAQYFPQAHAADEATGKAWIALDGERFVLETLDDGDRRFVSDIAQARAEASQRSGLNPNAPITLRAFASTDAFRDETLSPGWVAAFTEGNWIATQPLRTLAARNLLSATLRHEFLHALVEQEAGPAAPLWLREGLVEFWSASDAAAYRQQTPQLTLEQVDAALRHSDTEARSEAAHREAAIYAARLLVLYGRDRVLQWLHSGIPVQVILSAAHR